MRVLTAAEARGLDERTIASGRASAEQLMQRAGEAVARAIVEQWGDPLAWRVLVLCGGGANGGDGLVAARALQAMGAQVRVVVLAARERLSASIGAQLEATLAAGVRVDEVTEVFGTENDIGLSAQIADGPWDVVIDAILGTGAKGGPRGIVRTGAAALLQLRSMRARVVAVDLPTGISADDGSVADPAVRAHLTVTFGCAKRGHWLHPGRSHCGELRVADIGLDAAGDLGVELLEASTVALPRRDPRAHKGDAGRVLVVGGAAGMTGAVVLTARGAYRAGAGYVRACVPASVADSLLAACPELMSVACGETVARSLTVSAEREVLAEASTARAVVLGPGLSRDPKSAVLARALTRAIGTRLVLDADALNALSPALGETGLVACVRERAAETVITPHVGEMALLTGLTTSEVEARRIDLAAESALAWGVTVVLKGAPTVIASPDGRTAICPTGHPGMATAGMGDVLAGAIGAFLAQGLGPHAAACTAAYVHGRAGERAVSAIGETGLLASDVAEQLPQAMQELRDAR